MLWRVIVCGLVEKLGGVRQGQKTVGEPRRNPQLPLVVPTQMHPHPMAEGFRALSEVDRNIEDFALHHPHQLALRLLDLVVQATQDVLCRLRMVVLDEFGIQPGGLLEGAGIEALEKEAAVVTKNLGFEDENVGDGCGDDVHGRSPSFIKRSRYCP